MHTTLPIRPCLPIAMALGLTLGIAPAVRAEFDTVVETGPSSNRVDVFFLGDGYTASDIGAGTYANHVQSFVDYMFSNTVNSDPFFRYQNYFNIYRVNVLSAESGADIPQQGIFKNTALNSSYRWDGVTDQLLYLDVSLANNQLNSAIASSGKTAELQFATVNESLYGGGGGSWAVFSGANSSARELGLHESGHTFSDLADEYGGPGTHIGPEPPEINVTKNSSGARWSQWLGYNDPTGSVVGAYEGARYHDAGIYRPTQDSKMRTLGVPFNAVSREKIILDIYGLVDPLDDYTSNATTLVDPLSLAAMPVDPDVISTQWFIDGLHNPALDGASTLDVSGLGLSMGSHTVELRAFDPMGFDPLNGWVRIQTDTLEQFVEWDVLIQVPEPASVALAAVALVGFALIAGRRARRRRRLVY